MLQDRLLFADGIDEYALTAGAGCKFFLKRGEMPVSATGELLHKRFMPPVKGFPFPDPTQCFRMTRIPSFASMLGHDIPKPVKLTMLGEQMFPAQMFRMDVPDAHRFNPTAKRCPSGAGVSRYIDLLDHDDDPVSDGYVVRQTPPKIRSRSNGRHGYCRCRIIADDARTHRLDASPDSIL